MQIHKPHNFIVLMQPCMTNRITKSPPYLKGQQKCNYFLVSMSKINCFVGIHLSCKSDDLYLHHEDNIFQSAFYPQKAHLAKLFACCASQVPFQPNISFSRRDLYIMHLTRKGEHWSILYFLFFW